MKSIPLLTALLSLKALGVYAVDCRTDVPLDPNGPSGADIASSIQLGENGPVNDLCMNRFKDIEAGPITYNAGPLVFSLSRTEGVLHPTGDCKSALTNIISQCLVGQNVWGGSAETNGLLFEISEGDGVDEVHTLQSRKVKLGKTKGKTTPKDKKKKKKKTKSKKGGTKPKTKKGTTSKTKKIKSKKPTSKTKKPSSKTKKPTSTKKPASTKVSTSKCNQTGKPKGGKGGKKGGKGKRGESDGESCPIGINWPKAFEDAGTQLAGMVGVEKPLLAREIDTSPLSGRDFYVGGMSGMMARREIEARASKTTHKTGSIFKSDKKYTTSWNAGDYPTTADKVGTKAFKYYGWTDPESPTIYVFKDPFTGAAPKVTAKGTKIQYDLEHIMEWQIVTGFFDWIWKVKAKGAVFPNPSGGKDKVEFPEYFLATWMMDEVVETPTKPDDQPDDKKDDKTDDTAAKVKRAGGSKGKGKKDQPKVLAEAQRFQLDDDTGKPVGDELTPREHLTSIYPAAGNDYAKEFCYLEGRVNSPAKTLAFNPKVQEEVTVYAKDTSEINLRSKTYTRKGKKLQGKPENQVELLKSLLGVRKYMRNAEISKAFNEQQDRMGKKLGELDSQLSKHPKIVKEEDTTDPDPDTTTLPDRTKPDTTKPDAKVKRANGKEPAVDEPTFAWTKMGLEALWGEWIDLRFKTAEDRIDAELKYSLAELVKLAATSKDKELKDSIDKLKAQWDTEMNIDWKMPWTAHPKATATIPGEKKDEDETETKPADA